jgi:hypothetical protein
MTVKEYREKHPNCQYCNHRTWGMDRCSATDKRMSKRTAKKCPCYIPEKWYLDTNENEGLSDDSKRT